LKGGWDGAGFGGSDFWVHGFSAQVTLHAEPMNLHKTGYLAQNAMNWRRFMADRGAGATNPSDDLEGR
jgi:hypothetical protein